MDMELTKINFTFVNNKTHISIDRMSKYLHELIVSLVSLILDIT